MMVPTGGSRGGTHPVTPQAVARQKFKEIVRHEQVQSRRAARSHMENFYAD